MDEVRHLELDDLGDPGRACVDVHPEPVRHPLDGAPGGGEVEPHGAAREVVGVEASEHQIRVRHRGHVAAPAVADRAGLGPGALRADPEGARHLVDPDHAPAPAPDRLDVHLRQVVLVLVHLAPERVGGLAAVDDPDVERGAAHVGGDDVLVAHRPGRVPRAHHPRDRPRVEGEERRAARDLDGDGAARGLGDLERGAVSRPREPPLDVREVARGDRPHVGVEARGGGSLVLAPLGHELVGAGDEEARGEVPDDVPHPALVRGLEERPQEADRDRLHVLGEQLANGRLGLRLVEGHDDLPEAVHALGDAANEALRHDRARLLAFRDVHHLAHFAAVEPARAPHDVDDVVVPAGGDEADPGAPLLDDRVRADGGAVGYERGVREKLPDRLPDLAGRRFERVHEALGEVARRRGRLGAHHPAPVVDDHAVGKRSPDVEAAEILGHGLGRGAPFGIELVRGRLAAPPDSITIASRRGAGTRAVDRRRERCPTPPRSLHRGERGGRFAAGRPVGWSAGQPVGPSAGRPAGTRGGFRRRFRSKLARRRRRRSRGRHPGGSTMAMSDLPRTMTALASHRPPPRPRGAVRGTNLMAGGRPSGPGDVVAPDAATGDSVPANRRGRRRGRATPKGRQVDPAACEDIRGLIGDGPHQRDHLIEHLHLVQDRFGALHARHLAALAAEHRLSQAEVYEVATFYAHFDIVADGAAPPPPVTVRVCDSLSCELAGAVPLMAALEEGRPDGVRVVRAPCMGRCDTAPVAEVGHHHIDHATAESVLAAAAAGDTHPHVPDYEDYDAYVESGGYAVLEDCRAGRRTVDQAVETLNEAGLRGLGGAGFPTGRKWSIVRSYPGPRLMAVNADEGEPGTFKDRYYLERRPHQFLEGVLIAAWAVEAETVYIYLRDEYPAVREILEAEIARLEREGRTGPAPPRAPARGGGLHLRRRIVDARIDRGQARPSAAPSSVRGGGGPLRATDPGAERRDPLLGARDPRPRRRLVRGGGEGRGEGPSQLLGLRAGARARGQARGRPGPPPASSSRSTAAGCWRGTRSGATSRAARRAGSSPRRWRTFPSSSGPSRSTGASSDRTRS